MSMIDLDQYNANLLWNVLDNVVLTSHPCSQQAQEIDKLLSQLQTLCVLKGGGFDRNLQVIIDEEFSVTRHYV